MQGLNAQVGEELNGLRRHMGVLHEDLVSRIEALASA
jgi:hypothetical protein